MQQVDLHVHSDASDDGAWTTPRDLAPPVAPDQTQSRGASIS